MLWAALKAAPRARHSGRCLISRRRVTTVGDKDPKNAQKKKQQKDAKKTVAKK
jgi:hypothetical protein